METRLEKDSMGEILVPAESHWGAQTQRSLQNFAIGEEKMPPEVIEALASIKKAAARVNHSLGKLPLEKSNAIQKACDEILAGNLQQQFPLSVWQTGSGTQTNMNVNEVIAHYGVSHSLAAALHPNDDVNLSQSSNDVFPSAMHIAALLSIEKNLLPALASGAQTLLQVEQAYPQLLKIGRTHLQDATPLRFSQEVSGWRIMLEESSRMIQAALPPLRQLALGGTAVGTGLNAPENFGALAAQQLTQLTGSQFYTAPNKFHALTSKDALVFAHGALKATAANLMKIAGDIRLLASGPRCGLGELTLPENEPGSSIMPGKVNPTQCEAVTMVACQVMANDVAVGFAASQGQLQLNVFMPVCIYNFLQSVRLLADSTRSFTRHCLAGLVPNPAQMEHHLSQSLMLVTALSPHIGYDKAAKAAQYAFHHQLSLRQAVVALEYLDGPTFDAAVLPEKMV